MQATEGDWGVVDARAWGTPLSSVREHANRRSIARRSRRGIGIGGRALAWVNTVGFRCENTRNEESNSRNILLFYIDLVGLLHLYADSHTRQVHNANGSDG
jgi:hypothetical protein